MALPAKKRNNRQQNDYKRKQFQVIFFSAGNKSLELLSHGARPFRHCRSPFSIMQKSERKQFLNP